jgi:hypothetical protein
MAITVVAFFWLCHKVLQHSENVQHVHGWVEKYIFIDNAVSLGITN